MKFRLAAGGFLLFALAYSAIGFDAGLLNSSALDLLFDQNPSRTLEEIVQLTKTQGFLVNLHVENYERNPLELPFSSRPQLVSADANRPELLRIYRQMSRQIRYRG